MGKKQGRFQQLAEIGRKRLQKVRLSKIKRTNKCSNARREIVRRKIYKRYTEWEKLLPIIGYGEMLRSSVSNIISVLKSLPKGYSITENSTFIDIGSCLGRAVAFVKTEVRCRCIGIEINREYHDYAQRKYKEHTNLEFILGNAGDMNNTIQNATHIYSFNKVFLPDDLINISECINNSANCKVVAWSRSEHETGRLLPNYKLISKVETSMGTGAFLLYVYIKQKEKALQKVDLKLKLKKEKTELCFVEYTFRRKRENLIVLFAHLEFLKMKRRQLCHAVVK